MMNEGESLYADALQDEVKRLRADLAEARETIADYEDSHRITVDNCGAPDEKHCSCVPSLRLEIKRLTAERDGLIERDRLVQDAVRWAYEDGAA